MMETHLGLISDYLINKYSDEEIVAIANASLISEQHERQMLRIETKTMHRVRFADDERHIVIKLSL